MLQLDGIMCGRFSLTQSAETIMEAFELPNTPVLTPRYNIAPTQQVATIVKEARQKYREFQWMRWGLIPRWAKDAKIGNRLINARAETLTEKPSFRDAIKYRRCLIVADGFYEWQKVGNRKQPHYFQMQSGEVFAFAGLWEVWQSTEGEAITSCTIITTDANSLMQSIHDRMPLILPFNAYDQWLDPTLTQPKLLQTLLTPYDSNAMKVIAVSAAVNNPAHDQPECVKALA